MRSDKKTRADASTRRAARSGLVAVAALISAAMMMSMLLAPMASASTLRYMGWNRYDLLLDGNETRTASSSAGGAAFVCWQSGIAGKISIVPCMGIVSVCAAKARLRGHWAGMTIEPISWTGPRFWCWDY
jgi:hypothetical protein